MTAEPTNRRPRGLPIRGTLLQRLRVERGWTQKEAALAVGVYPRSYQTWEEKGDEARVDPGNLAKILDAFDLTQADILADGFQPPADARSLEDRVDAVERIVVELVARMDMLEPVVKENRVLVREHHDKALEYFERVLTRIGEAEAGAAGQLGGLAVALHELQTEVAGLPRPGESAPHGQSSGAT